MIIFGWGHVTDHHYGPTVALTCRNCNNDGWYHLYGYRKWFTLFFIPVFPYESKHLLLCPVCSQGFELSGDRVEQAKRLNELTGRFIDKQIAETEYQYEADKLQVLG